jgi:2-(1,2-epoxy-1,2-dihydrophenyl)acetyl-CoA isomerase
MTIEHIRLRDSQLTLDNGVAEFTHLRAAARNALSDGLRADYGDLLDRIEGDTSVRALIITGSGGSFCAGGDVKGMRERLANSDPSVNSPAATRRRLHAAQAWLDRLRCLEIPVIAAVDGPAFGAGFSLALVADFVLASSRAEFCMSFLKVGAVPDFGAFHTLPRLVGLARAKELMLTARRMGASEAVEMGVALRVHDVEDLLPQARRLARRFLAAPPEALGLTKRLLHKSFEADYRVMAELEACAQAVCMATPYHAEAVARFARGERALFDWERMDDTASSADKTA